MKAFCMSTTISASFGITYAPSQWRYVSAALFFLDWIQVGDQNWTLPGAIALVAALFFRAAAQTAAAHLAAALGGMSALARCRQLSCDHLVDQRDIRGYVEELSRQLGGTGLGALAIEYVDRTSLAHA
jgi:hypothetical protein